MIRVAGGRLHAGPQMQFKRSGSSSRLGAGARDGDDKAAVATVMTTDDRIECIRRQTSAAGWLPARMRSLMTFCELRLRPAALAGPGAGCSLEARSRITCRRVWLARFSPARPSRSELRARGL